MYLSKSTFDTIYTDVNECEVIYFSLLADLETYARRVECVLRNARHLPDGAAGRRAEAVSEREQHAVADAGRGLLNEVLGLHHGVPPVQRHGYGRQLPRLVRLVRQAALQPTERLLV